ncbi:MAG: hypothetical protein IPG32_13630 [Saprospirales bacterium]|nr:hypothetical protein [Saprospirales bacterium]
MTQEELDRLCNVCIESEVDFVKTSTGILAAGANVDIVSWLRAQLPPSIKIKASGGGRSYQDAVLPIEAGLPASEAPPASRSSKEGSNKGGTEVLLIFGKTENEAIVPLPPFFFFVQFCFQGFAQGKVARKQTACRNPAGGALCRNPKNDAHRTGWRIQLVATTDRQEMESTFTGFRSSILH